MSRAEQIEVDVAVIGAGVIGLAVAEALSRNSPKSTVVLIERHSKLGQESSSHNSEVIHAGLYYGGLPLKEQSCLRGKELLYSFCDTWDVPYRRCGKFIVSTDVSQLEALERIYQYGSELGVPLEHLTVEETRRRLKHPSAGESLWSPSSGIVDTHSLMARLEAMGSARGVIYLYSHSLRGIDRHSGTYSCQVTDPQDRELIVQPRILLNCAGLAADRVARMCNPEWKIETRPCRGRYFGVSGRWTNAFESLYYPLPDPRGGLGIHLTIDLGGKCRLGPDVDWSQATVRPADDPDLYRFASEDEAMATAFFEAGRKLLPGLLTSDLSPDYIGVRSKLFVDGEAHRDFMLKRGTDSTSDQQDFHFMGIESPGVTASLALAELLVSQVSDYL